LSISSCFWNIPALIFRYNNQKFQIGIELANDGSANYLYATDFHNGKIDVFDKSFNLVNSKPFIDPTIPAGFAPFNIRLIDDELYVTYAKQLAPANHDDQKGPGNGFS